MVLAGGLGGMRNKKLLFKIYCVKLLLEYQFGKMKKFWRLMVVMVAQQCECT